MSKKNQNYTNRKQNRFQPERMRGNVFVNNSGKQWLPGENGRAAKVERLLRGLEKKEIACNMAGYKDSGVEWIGAIPKEWNTCKIDTLYSVRSSRVSDRDFMPLSVTMQGVLPRLQSVAKTDNHDDRKLVMKNDFVINSRSDRRGSCGISQYDGSVSLINIVLKPTPKNITMEPRYFGWLFRSSVFSDEFYRLGHGIVDDLWTTTWNDMRKMTVALPPLPEQQRIADFLDTKCGILDRTIDAVSRQIEDLEKYKKALITKTVTKGICKKGEPERAMKDSGVEWIGGIPEEWDVSKVKYNFSTFKKIPGKESEKYERLSLTMNGVKHREKWTAEGLQPKDFMSYQLLRKGDLVFRLIDLQNPSKSRRVALSHDTGLISPAYTILHADNNKMLPEYAEMFFLMMSYLDVFNALGSCGVRSSINNAELMKIPVPVPPLAEQQQIADYLDEKCKNIDNRVQKRRQQLEWLKEYKKSLIFDYVTGKKRV